MPDKRQKLIIIGSGPAGLTAAIYSARAQLSPLVIAGAQSGGQLMLTSEVENFPGFPEGVQGPELMTKMREQAERFGAVVVEEDATSVDFSTRPLKVSTDYDTFETDAVIIATGASAVWLGLPGERELIGRGISSCATCDGFFFRGKEIVVVGGGDTAMEEALFLTRFASKVTVIHRREQLRASKIMQDRAFKDPKIGFIWNTIVDEIIGNGQVEAIRLKNVQSGDLSVLPIDGVFVAIGYTPNTAIFRDQIDLNEKGYVNVRHETHSSVEGVFVAGDVEDVRYRQAVTAAGAGCKAAMDAEHYLAGLGQ
ncbi:MAG TPA: thioredoxin-disulfide reductase [Chloroflexota bacterium]|nr:thioredoxin-disulfide reductase [Chloroflexota bacterium]